MKNKLIAVSWGASEQPLSSYSVLKKYWEKDEEELDFENVVENAMVSAYGADRTVTDEGVTALVDISQELVADIEELKNLLDPLQGWIEESWDFFKD